MPTYIPLVCHNCNTNFQKTIKDFNNSNQHNAKHYFCSIGCKNQHYRTRKTLACTQCNINFQKLPSQIKKSKNHFCSRSCAATYNNKHKTHGTRRSKLEAYLEEQLRKDFPNLVLLCNDKTAINSELDFYFPELRFAIELNGIFHYEPIYGKDKLEKIQSNDQQKMLLCAQNGIELAIVDSSLCKKLTKKSKDKYWLIVRNLVDQIKDRAK